jgi:hypothetical protein
MKTQPNDLKVIVRRAPCQVLYGIKNNNFLLVLMFCNDFLIDNIYDLFKLWLQQPTGSASYFIPSGEDFALDLYALFTAHSITWQDSAVVVVSLILAAAFSVLCALPYLVSPAI